MPEVGVPDERIAVAAKPTLDLERDQYGLHLLQRRVDCGDLRDDIDRLAVLEDHAPDSTNLASDLGEARIEFPERLFIQRSVRHRSSPPAARFTLLQARL